MAYKSYLSTELSYPLDAKNSHLNAAGYYGDQGETLEGGRGFDERRSVFARSKTAQFIAKLDLDLMNQPQYLVNHCELDIEITPNDSNFLLIAPTAGQLRYHFEVMTCKLYVKKVELTDGLALSIAKKLDAKPARYAVRKSMMKSFHISTGRYEFHTNLFTEHVPRRIILGLVGKLDYNGVQSRSPFNFQHFHVREISVQANGRSYPQAPYDLDYANKNAIRAFHDMNEAIGYAGSTESNGITYQQYLNTHCLYIFNMTNSGEDEGNLFDLVKNGATALSIKFAEPVPADGIMLVVMGEADALIMMDKYRMISSDTTI
jgi:hypothetical protein